MEKNEQEKFILEVRGEQQISSFIDDKDIISIFKDGIYDINDFCGTKINYNEDLKARSLLKNYILYARYKRLAEFKESYFKEYDELQRHYYTKSKK